MNSDIVIIGGGVIGLAIARALALRGAGDICLMERSELGIESSHAAAGMLAPQVEANSNDEFFRLACLSRDMYVDFAAALQQETDINIELDTTGTIYLAISQSDLAECNRRYEWQTSASLSVEKLTSTEVRELEQQVNPAVRGGLLFPNDVQVENRRLVSALASSTKRLGVSILTHTRCEEIQTRNNRIVGVKTSNALVASHTVVVAAGWWSGSIPITGTERHGIAPNMEPVRGQMICLEAKPQLSRHVIYSPRGYIVPRHDGRLLAGSTSEPATFIKQTTAGGIAAILHNAREISPHIDSLPIVDMWAGLRPKSPDGLPVLGPCGEIDGLHFATGHYRNGILLAPVTGELIAKAIMEPETARDFAPFSPDRLQRATVNST